jgi:tRNA threonylcarbamoyladenosine dehydratase
MAQGRLTNFDHVQEWPEFLQDANNKAILQGHQSSRPTIIDMSQPRAATRLEQLIAKNPITRVIDNYDEQLAEALVSRQPQLYQASYEVKRASLEDYLKKHYVHQPGWRKGSWVYYPWSGYLVHILEKEVFFEARTTRNRDLITAKEQEKFAAYHVGCAGMSVGSNVALSLLLQGGSNQLKIADGAVLSGSNLNRVIAGVHNIGDVKSDIVARSLYEANPYAEIERFATLTPKNIDQFFDGPWALDVVVDEIDDLEMKIRLRIEARKRRIPVVMATDLGDDVMLDIERYDLNKSLPLFHGLAGDIETVLGKQLTRREWLKYATTIINTKNVPLRMQQSLLKIGTKLVAQPQLGSTAIMAGSTVSYALRQLALGHALKSGRMIISFDKELLKGANSPRRRLARYRHAKLVQRTLDAL